MSKNHCFQHHSRFSFSHFSIISNPDGSPSQISGPLSSRSETKLKGWSLNAEEVRCQLPPTLRDQIRFPTGTCLLPIFPYLLLPGIQWYQQPITAQIPSTCTVGSAISLAFFFSIPRNPGSIVLVVLRSLEGKGIPYLWLEYCLGSPKQTFSWPGVN